MSNHSVLEPGIGVNSSSVGQILDRVKISDIYQALGGPRLRFNRGPAFWRAGDNRTAISLDDRKNVFHDFVSGEGGGVLALVQIVLGVQKRDALEWLADYAGVPLAPTVRRTAAEVAEYKRCREAAEIEAEEFLAWRKDVLDSSRRKRNQLLETYHASKRFLFRYPEEACLRYGGYLELKMELAWAVQFEYWPKIERADAELAAFENAPFEELLDMFRRAEPAEIAA